MTRPPGEWEDLKMEGKYAKEAAQFCEYIRTLAGKPENLENLESYLSMHFAEWLTKWANTPQDMASEMREFANMII